MPNSIFLCSTWAGVEVIASLHCDDELEGSKLKSQEMEMEDDDDDAVSHVNNSALKL